jgi:hypothetical protein
MRPGNDEATKLAAARGPAEATAATIAEWLKLTGGAQLVGTGGGGGGGGRQREVGLVMLRFIRPGGLVSEVSDILLRACGC